MRNQQQRTPLMKEQIEALRQELSSLGKDEQERILICKTAFIRGWKGFYPLTKKKSSSSGRSSGKANKPGNNNFHNFEGRDYDYAAIEEKLTGGN